MLLGSYSFWEAGLAAMILLLSILPFASQLAARRRGLTRNVSRLVVHAVLIGLSTIYLALTLLWASALEWSEVPGRSAPVGNWTYLLLAAMIAVVTSLEVISHLRARRQGLTRNLSRLVIHLALLATLVVMVGINQAKWSLYQTRLQRTYAPSLPG